MIKAKEFRQPAYEIDSTFTERWSPRSFLEKQVPYETLLSLFEAARWAPSANNLQPWRFIIAQTNADREKFHSFINQSNLVWCQKAPILAVLVSKTTTDNGNNRNHAFDSGTAWGYLALEAVNKGLITHPIGGFDREKAREVLELPTEYEAQIVIAIGYQGEKDTLSENLQLREQPSTRRPLNETLFECSFHQQVK